MDITPRVAATVVAAMTEREMTQLGLSEATGIPFATLNRRLKGVTPFNVSELYRIAEALGVDWTTLADATDKAAS